MPVWDFSPALCHRKASSAWGRASSSPPPAPRDSHPAFVKIPPLFPERNTPLREPLTQVLAPWCTPPTQPVVVVDAALLALLERSDLPTWKPQALPWHTPTYFVLPANAASWEDLPLEAVVVTFGPRELTAWFLGVDDTAVGVTVTYGSGGLCDAPPLGTGALSGVLNNANAVAMLYKVSLALLDELPDLHTRSTDAEETQLPVLVLGGNTHLQQLAVRRDRNPKARLEEVRGYWRYNHYGSPQIPNRPLWVRPRFVRRLSSGLGAGESHGDICPTYS